MRETPKLVLSFAFKLDLRLINAEFVSYNDRSPPPHLPSCLPDVTHVTLPGLPPPFLHTVCDGGGNSLGTRLLSNYAGQVQSHSKIPVQVSLQVTGA